MAHTISKRIEYLRIKNDEKTKMFNEKKIHDKNV